MTLEVASPRHEVITEIHAVAHMASSNPPSPEVKYQIEFSKDNGATWKPIVKDWTITRRGPEPEDFWSQSFCYGSVEISGTDARSARVRFSNDGGKNVLRAEAHLVYRTPEGDGTRVTFDWMEAGTERSEQHVFSPQNREPWKIPTGHDVQTRRVEFEPVIQP